MGPSGTPSTLDRDPLDARAPVFLLLAASLAAVMPAGAATAPCEAPLDVTCTDAAQPPGNGDCTIYAQTDVVDCWDIANRHVRGCLTGPEPAQCLLAGSPDRPCDGAFDILCTSAPHGSRCTAYLNVGNVQYVCAGDASDADCLRDDHPVGCEWYWSDYESCGSTEGLYNLACTDGDHHCSLYTVAPDGDVVCLRFGDKLLDMCLDRDHPVRCMARGLT